MDYFTKCLKSRKEIGNKKGIASSLNNIGAVYKNLGEFTKAIDYYIKSLKINEEIGNKSGISNTLNNIGSVYLKHDAKAGLYGQKFKNKRKNRR